MWWFPCGPVALSPGGPVGEHSGSLLCSGGGGLRLFAQRQVDWWMRRISKVGLAETCPSNPRRDSLASLGRAVVRLGSGNVKGERPTFPEKPLGLPLGHAEIPQGSLWTPCCTGQISQRLDLKLASQNNGGRTPEESPLLWGFAPILSSGILRTCGDLRCICSGDCGRDGRECGRGKTMTTPYLRLRGRLRPAVDGLPSVP